MRFTLRFRFAVAALAAVLLIPAALANSGVSTEGEANSPSLQYLTIATIDSRPISIDRLLYTACKNAGWNTSFTPLPMLTGYTLSNDNEAQVDGVIASTPDIDQEYPNLLRVNVPLETVFLCAFTRTEDGRTSFSAWDDLAGLSVGVQSQRPYIRSKMPAEAKIVEKETVALLLEGLVSGEYDTVILSKRGHETLSVPDGIVQTGVLDQLTDYLYLHKSHSDLIPSLSDVLNDMIMDGRAEDILNDIPIPETNTMKTVLHILSTDSEITREAKFTAALRGSLEEEVPIDWYTTSLYTRRFQRDPNRLANIASLMRQDCVSRNVAAIVVSGDSALEYVISRYNLFFRNIPVLFYGVSDAYSSIIQGYEPYVTGIVEKLDAMETAQTALTLFPNTDQLLVINDHSAEGERYRSIMEKQLAPLADTISISYSKPTSIQTLLDDIQTLPETAAVFIGSYSIDSEGQYYILHEMKRLLDSHCSVPIFSLYSTAPEYNAVGGKCLDYEACGIAIAGMLKQILRGADVSDFPITDTSDHNRWVFDKIQMDAFGIRESSLPVGASIVGRIPSIWESDPRMATTLVLTAVLSILGIVALGLFIVLRRRRKAQIAYNNMLAHAAEKEREANQLKSRFLVNMSHEIRTPMNAIIGLTEIALRKSPPQEMRDVFRKVLTSAQSLLEIINDILDLSKIEADKIELFEDEFELEEVLNSTLLVVSPRLEGKRVEFLLQEAPDLPRFIIGDRTRLWQILKNFLDNSAKYTDTGKIVLSIAVADEETDSNHIRLIFTVEDTGIGISEEQMNRLFLPYEQIYNDAQRRYTGTGLGMAISKQLCELMGGSMEIESKIGIGTTIRFHLTFRRSKNQEFGWQAARSDVLSGTRILAVDDDPLSLEIMEGLLSSTGAQVETADSGAQALTIIAKRHNSGGHFDVILLDYLMEGMNGLETAQKIQQSLSKTPKLLMVTAYQKLMLKSELARNGIDDIIEKPFSPTVFIQKVSAVLTRTSNTDSEPEPVSGLRFQNAHVLLCEDNLINQEVAVGIFEEFGVTAAVAENGKVGVELLENASAASTEHPPFDMIFMDLQMPVMDGYEATRLIRLNNRYQDIPIIALTADAMREVSDRCLEVGMNGYISKPVSFNRIQDEFTKWLPESKRI